MKHLTEIALRGRQMCRYEDEDDEEEEQEQQQEEEEKERNTWIYMMRQGLRGCYEKMMY